LAIKIAHIIDNLNTGGTETVAVNLANDLSKNDAYEMHIICVREDGEKKNWILPGVKLFYLHQKGSFDIRAFWRYFMYIRKHKIDIVHAHSISFLYPALLKLFTSPKLIWHDHYGMQVGPKGQRGYPYIQFSRFFDFVLCVNLHKVDENKKFLKTRKENIVFLPNYSILKKTTEPLKIVKGSAGFRLVIIANVRPVKDYITLLKALFIVKQTFAQVFIYALGDHLNIAYNTEVRKLIGELKLEDNIELTGLAIYPDQYLNVADLAILCSTFEGMPLSLIEYGLKKLPVIATNVGHCAHMLGNGKMGWLVEKENPEQLAEKIIYVLQNKQEAVAKAALYNNFVIENYSESKVIRKLEEYYKLVLEK
jgi:glycosyltransferase involved in cell wall biosynthesis